MSQGKAGQAAPAPGRPAAQSTSLTAPAAAAPLAAAPTSQRVQPRGKGAANDCRPTISISVAASGERCPQAQPRGGTASAAAALSQADPPAPQPLACGQQQQQQQVPASLPEPPQREHEHNTRLAQRQRAERAQRRVSFAPGPWAHKFSTPDGHPDHEGELARQRRSAGMGWGRDLTPSAVRAVEAELGEDCRPSIDRLKRRVGLLPLRRRSAEYYLVVNGRVPGGVAAAAARPSAAAEGAAAGGGAARGGETASKMRAKQAPVGQHAARALVGAPPGVKGMQAASGAAAEPCRHGQAAAAASTLQATASVPPASAVFGRKRSHADVMSAMQQQQQQQTSPASGKRSSQRLGGLFGPVGSLGAFSRRSSSSSSGG